MPLNGRDLRSHLEERRCDVIGKLKKCLRLERLQRSGRNSRAIGDTATVIPCESAGATTPNRPPEARSSDSQLLCSLRSGSGSWSGSGRRRRSSNSADATQHASSPRGIRRGTRADFLHNGTFHEAIGAVLVLAQCFCLMPVRGVRAKSAKGLSFRWLRWRTCYSLLHMLATVLSSGLIINMIVQGNLAVRNMAPLIFYTSILMASFLFLRLAAQWPRLMLHWERVERQMPPYRDWREREELAYRIKMLTLSFVMLSLMEYILYTISVIHFANYCPSRADPIESYFFNVLKHVFMVFDYSPWLAWSGKIQNVLLTFGWTYMDVFVMIIGIGLSHQFKRVHRKMERSRGKLMSECYWTQTRLQYRLICELIVEVDAAISGIILVSFANNLYFVCMQLLNSLNKMPSIAHAVYFYFSLLFLIGRTIAVSLFLSEVNDRSRDPLYLLKYVPQSAYNAEIERFANEMTTDVVALTGLRLFNVTRKLMLTVAGTIVTYELVLIQFHEDQNLWNCGTD